jgi:hypothetical protein
METQSIKSFEFHFFCFETGKFLTLNSKSFNGLFESVYIFLILLFQSVGWFDNIYGWSVWLSTCFKRMQNTYFFELQSMCF